MKSALSAIGAAAVALVIGGVLLLSRPAAPKPAGLVGDAGSPSPTVGVTATAATTTPAVTASPSPTATPIPVATTPPATPVPTVPPIGTWTGAATTTVAGKPLLPTAFSPPFTADTEVRVCYDLGTASIWDSLTIFAYPHTASSWSVGGVAEGQTTGCNLIPVPAVGRYTFAVSAAGPWSITVTPDP